MSGALLLTAALMTVAQAPPVPEELRATQPRTIDPALPAQLRPALEKACEAELDPKRGTGNAVEILKQARDQLTDVPLKLQLDLRIAGIILRSRFVHETKYPEPQRVARALSTFSRLDVTEPCLGAWVKRAIDAATPAAKGAINAKNGRRISLALTAQGAGIDVDATVADLAKVYATLGLELVKGTPKDADYVGKLAALEVRDEGGKAAVRVTLDLAANTGAEPRWKRTYYRTAIATDAKVAATAAVSWLMRMGGRDLLFTWLDRKGIEGVIMAVPGEQHDHDHDHGPGPAAAPERAPIEGTPASPPPRVQISGGGAGKQPAPPPSPSPSSKKQGAP